MREAAKQLKIEQEKKEAERRKVIFFNFIIIIYTLLITIYSIIFAKEDKGSRPKNGLCTVVRVDTHAPLRHPDRKKTVFWTTFLMWFSAGMIRWQKHKVKMNPMLGYQRENGRRKEPWRSNRPTAERNLQRLPQVGTFLYHYLSLSKTVIWEGSSTIKTSIPRITIGTICLCCHQEDCCPREWEVWSWARCSSEI